MQTYSTLLFADVGRTEGFETLCPSGWTMVVRSIDVYSASVLAQITFGNTLLGNTFFAAFIPRGIDPLAIEPGSFQWTGRQVFCSPEGIGCNIEAGTWDIEVSGYMLKGCPPFYRWTGLPTPFTC